MKREKIIGAIAFMLIFLFIYAATSKLLEFQKFSIQIGKSPMLTNFSMLIAIGIPLIEITISVLLGIRKFRLIGLYSSFALLILFSGYIIAVTRFSTNIPCSCGGVLQNMSWNQHLVFNIAFAILNLTGILLYKNNSEIPDPGTIKEKLSVY